MPISRPTKVGLNEYLSSLKRIDRILSQLSATNLRVNQQAVGDYNELLSEGSQQLQTVFRSILLENVQPVEPLHFLTKGKSSASHSRPASEAIRSTIPDNTTREGAAAWLY